MRIPAPRPAARIVSCSSAQSRTVAQSVTGSSLDLGEPICPIGWQDRTWTEERDSRNGSIIALVALFVVGTVLPINMGALAYVAAWLVGMYSLNLDEKEILAGVSGDLVLTLIGVTYLFAIARNNGTVDLIVRSAVKGVGGGSPSSRG